MKKLLLGLASMLTIYSANSQSIFEKEINTQVWNSFIEAFNEGNDEAYSTLHSKDFIRVLRDNNRIYGFDEAFKVQPDSIKQKWAEWKRNIELRFIERVVSADKAFEIGYYKITSSNTSTGEQRVSYGMFHVLLRKENGVWKILMDADGHEGVDEKIFQNTKPLVLR